MWYCHVSGEWPSLSKALNALIGSGEKFTPECNAAIHAKFFATPYETLPLHSMAERIESELSTVLGSLEQASRSASEYGRFWRVRRGRSPRGTAGTTSGEFLVVCYVTRGRCLSKVSNWNGSCKRPRRRWRS